MKTTKLAVRNRLVDLLLSSFNDSEKRVAIKYLSLFCSLMTRKERMEFLLVDFLREEGDVSLPVSDVSRFLGHLVGADRLLRLRREGTGETALHGIPGPEESAAWILEPLPDVRAALPVLCQRVRVYAQLAARMGEPAIHLRLEDPLRKTMREAALCFNAGLFFEAHEHLEHHWATQPNGPGRRFLQGIIQISVGFHHAQAGKYDGAVNQLGKGLEKTLGTVGEFFGLSCDAFLPEVAAVRAAIVKRGRKNMRPLPLAEIPRMPV